MVSDMDLAAQMTDLTQELAGKYGADAQRDPTIPAGTVLSQQETEAGYVREVKQNSMVRLGNQPLPPRFEAWDVYGRPSMLPMAQMYYMLTKENAERPGVRAFHLHRGAVTRENCTICPATREKFEGTCVWCFERTAGAVQKRFETEDARDRHVRAFHPDESDALERRLDRELQREGMELQRKQTEAMMALVQQQLGAPAIADPDPVAAEAVAAERDADVNTTYTCAECSYVSPTGAGLAAHRRHQHGVK